MASTQGKCGGKSYIICFTLIQIDVNLTLTWYLQCCSKPSKSIIQPPSAPALASTATTTAMSRLCMIKVMQEGRSDCWPYIVAGEIGVGALSSKQRYRSVPQALQWNRTEHPADCRRSGRNTLCTLMPLGCKVLPFSI